MTEGDTETWSAEQYRNYCKTGVPPPLAPAEPIAAPDPCPPPSKKDDLLEKAIQDEVEQLLYHMGFWKRSTEWIREGEPPPAGWQYHLNPKKTKGNPILLDILLLRNDKQFIEFELKRPGGAYTSPEQRILCEDHGNPKFESSEAAIEYVKEWMKGAE